jgi:hypothetical protein
MSRTLDNCGHCHVCLENARDEYGLPVRLSRMIVCPECGNKRCPKATNHYHSCTNSNEPGQMGSIYGKKSLIGDWNDV